MTEVVHAHSTTPLISMMWDLHARNRSPVLEKGDVLSAQNKHYWRIRNVESDVDSFFDAAAELGDAQSMHFRSTTRSTIASVDMTNFSSLSGAGEGEGVGVGWIQP